MLPSKLGFVRTKSYLPVAPAISNIIGKKRWKPRGSYDFVLHETYLTLTLTLVGCSPTVSPAAWLLLTVIVRVKCSKQFHSMALRFPHQGSESNKFCFRDFPIVVGVALHEHNVGHVCFLHRRCRLSRAAVGLQLTRQVADELSDVSRVPGQLVGVVSNTESLLSGELSAPFHKELDQRGVVTHAESGCLEDLVAPVGTARGGLNLPGIAVICSFSSFSAEQIFSVGSGGASNHDDQTRAAAAEGLLETQKCIRRVVCSTVACFNIQGKVCK